MGDNRVELILHYIEGVFQSSMLHFCRVSTELSVVVQNQQTTDGKVASLLSPTDKIRFVSDLISSIYRTMFVREIDARST